ncbi:MAG: selenide, water dikinase SelD [Nitrospirota bacterium]
MGPADLEELLVDIHSVEHPSLIVGPGDDAGVHLIDGIAVVETVDVITPVVNDPFTFGAISAANSLSDVYAMGGTPRSALAVAGFPSCDYEPAVLGEILRGAVHTLRSAGAMLLGGHTFEDTEIKFGLSVTGVVDRERILKVSGAREGQVIVITKPLGIGILTTALKGGKLSDEEIGPAVAWMLTLNDRAAAAALAAGAAACTDITGFGLLGHAAAMVKGSSVDFVFERRRIPVLDRVAAMIDSGMLPEGAYNNLKFVDGKAAFAPGLTEEDKLLLADPQTSGGLLLTLPEEGLRHFESSSLFFSVIGRVVPGAGMIVVQ